jgi:2-haloacid dehalogenase
MAFTDYKILTYDTYGTLIDWEEGAHMGLGPLAERAGAGLSRDGVLETFAELEFAIQNETPAMLYYDVLAEVYRRAAARWDIKIDEAEALAFGRSVKDWPAFPDAPESLKYLRTRFRMATITNCDRISYMGSNARLEIEWDGIYTAQDVGCYKPSDRSFQCLYEWVRRDFGILPHEILHVAQSLTHDMVPATRAGLPKVWINRRHGQEGFGATKPPEGPYTIEWEYPSMAAFADAVRAEVGD